MDPDTPDAIIEIVSPKERQALAQQIKSEYQNAAELQKQSLYKEALKKYKWVFSQSIRPEFCLPSRKITQLMKGYPPAVTVVRRWRNDKEKLIMAQRFDLSLIQDWRRLNECLGEKNRCLEVYLKLEAAGAKQTLLHDILADTWMHFVRTKKYDALQTYLPHLGFHLIHHATEYDGAVLFPRHTSEEDRLWELDYHKDYMLKEGTMSYEVAIGLSRKTVATEFAKKILAVVSNDHSYARLIRGAIRARGYEEAIALYQDAKNSFSARKLKETSKEIRRLPKRYLLQLGLRS